MIATKSFPKGNLDLGPRGGFWLNAQAGQNTALMGVMPAACIECKRLFRADRFNVSYFKAGIDFVLQRAAECLVRVCSESWVFCPTWLAIYAQFSTSAVLFYSQKSILGYEIYNKAPQSSSSGRYSKCSTVCFWL